MSGFLCGILRRSQSLPLDAVCEPGLYSIFTRFTHANNQAKHLQFKISRDWSPNQPTSTGISRYTQPFRLYKRAAPTKYDHSIKSQQTSRTSSQRDEWRVKKRKTNKLNRLTTCYTSHRHEPSTRPWRHYVEAEDLVLLCVLSSTYSGGRPGKKWWGRRCRIACWSFGGDNREDVSVGRLSVTLDLDLEEYCATKVTS